MDIKIFSYEEFVKRYEKKYDSSTKCIVQGCDEPGYYEGGDARCWCPMCEKHVELPGYYLGYLRGLKHSIEIRMIWDKDDLSLKNLHSEIVDRINEFYKRIHN